jgi:hypothetical protein
LIDFSNIKTSLTSNIDSKVGNINTLIQKYNFEFPDLENSLKPIFDNFIKYKKAENELE